MGCGSSSNRSQAYDMKPPVEVPVDQETVSTYLFADHSDEQQDNDEVAETVDVVDKVNCGVDNGQQVKEIKNNGC
ncbi:hypothetical protein PoB_007202800 [Plakobranchus ocellatus]|uniref:Uncharacterized protein n=1 Tax=Plakobranchus ocellatus TaxID=259542 RepID=A0AAV4DMI2_9GAST|nr:hypothetical protein PoB_007202800 [Plakobranchus ocellatus]